MPNVSLYPNIRESVNGSEQPLIRILEAIKEGRWANKVESYRASVARNGKDDPTTQEQKKSIPYFTTSGTFSRRTEEGLKEHSGFVAVDIDRLADAEAVRNMVGADPFSFASFLSVGGAGVCVVVKVEPEDHHQAFEGLEKYFLSRYGIEIDTLADVSRARFISFDPGLILNEDSRVFEEDEPQLPISPEWQETSKSVGEGLEMAVQWVEKHYSFQSGERHKYIFHLACLCNRLGIPQSDLTAFVHARYPHFAANPSNAIKWAYKKLIGEHGILDRYMNKREKVENPEPTPAEVVALLGERLADWSKPVSEPEAIVSVEGHIISTAGNLTVISGPSKSGKSALGVAMMAGNFAKDHSCDTLGFSVMPNEAGKGLVYIDTEQSRYNFDRNFRNVVRRAKANTPPEWFKSYWLKGLAPTTLLQYTWQIGRFWADKFGGLCMLFADGIGDYLRSVNDEEKSFSITDEFMKMAEEFDCPVVTVLHQNYGSGKQRGHLGSHLRRKAESVLVVEKDKATGESKISYDLLRNAGMVPEIYFKYDTEVGYHAFCRTESVLPPLPDQQERDSLLLSQIFQGEGDILSTDFITRYTQLKTCGRSTATQALFRLVNEKKLQRVNGRKVALPGAGAPVTFPNQITIPPINREGEQVPF